MPAHRRDGRIRRIGGKIPAIRTQNAIELVADDARLNADRRFADGFDSPHAPRKVDDDSLADRCPRHAGPRSSAISGRPVSAAYRASTTTSSRSQGRATASGDT